MASTTFVDQQTVIYASWLNDVNLSTYTTVPTLTTNLTTLINTTLPASYVSKDSGTGAAALPSGTTAQRSASPSSGWARYNTTLNRFEGYNGSSWAALGGGATGGGADQVFVETNQNVTADYTISSGFNAMSAGPITIATGVTVTVPTGAVWSIV